MPKLNHAKRKRYERVTENAKRGIYALRVGDRVRVTKCPGTKRTFTFNYWDGGWMVSKSGIDDYCAVSIDRVNGMPRNFDY